MWLADAHFLYPRDQMTWIIEKHPTRQGSEPDRHTFRLRATAALYGMSGPVFSYKLRYIVAFWLVEMAISTNQKATIYRNLYENTGPGLATTIDYLDSSIVNGKTDIWFIWIPAQIIRARPFSWFFLLYMYINKGLTIIYPAGRG